MGIYKLTATEHQYTDHLVGKIYRTDDSQCAVYVHKGKAEVGIVPHRHGIDADDEVACHPAIASASEEPIDSLTVLHLPQPL